VNLHRTHARTRQGLLFETGVPVTFRYMRREEPAPYLGSRFGQDIEPAGTYMVLDDYDLWKEDPALSPGWSFGEKTFHNPLVIELVTDDGGHGGALGAPIFGPTGWKRRLSDAFGRRTGAALTRALNRAGHDGIVTVGPTPNDVREIVDLTSLPRSAAMRAKKNPFYLSLQEDDGEIESFGPMATAKLSFEDAQIEHVAEFVVDASQYTWKELGELIKERREEMEMTRADLANKTGLTKAYLGTIERGDEPARMTTVNLVSNALGFSIENKPHGGVAKTYKRISHGYVKENPVDPEIRAQLHPSDVRRLEKLEFEAVFYSDMADLLYGEGHEKAAEEYDVAAEVALDRLEEVSSEVIESGEPLTGGEQAQEGFTFDVQRFMISAWAKHLWCQRTGTWFVGGLDVPHRSQLADHIRQVLRSEFRDFRETTTDQELLEAAEDAYDNHMEYRLKQITGLRGAAAPIYLPGLER